MCFSLSDDVSGAVWCGSLLDSFQLFSYENSHLKGFVVIIIENFSFVALSSITESFLIIQSPFIKKISNHTPERQLTASHKIIVY